MLEADQPALGLQMTAAALEEAAYDRLFPYHAELCALSELRKKPGFGVPVQSGIGGHCILYLNGVRRAGGQNYPVLELCPPEAEPERQGVGISVNAHYMNANWVAAEGRDFLWLGGHAPGEPLTRAAYARTQNLAKAMGMLDGIEFHPRFFRDKPPEMSERDYMYEISVATDYAIRFGRDVFRARVPLDAARMGRIVAYLNALNAPYRSAERRFEWRLFSDNCAHVAHNALAEAGIWAPWPTGEFFLTAAFRFPAPKNEFVDLMLRMNDFPVNDAQAVHADAGARHLLLAHGVLPAGPGALAALSPALRNNEVYFTEKLRLIFYDNPFWGPYRPRFERIYATPRYTDLRANFAHFENILAAAPQAGAGVPADFLQLHAEWRAREMAKIRAFAQPQASREALACA